MLGTLLAAIKLSQLRSAYFELEASGTTTLMSHRPAELYNHPSITCIHTHTYTHIHVPRLKSYHPIIALIWELFGLPTSLD
ncbi:unnamed protein product [Onchocerca flexuosa]|nr:unnamed protein product [Onchocerca flexuosa]